MESQSTRNFFAEYLIAQAIEVANNAKGPVKYSTGRLIRNDIMRQMGSYNFQMKDLLPVIQEKLSERLDGYTVPNMNQFYNQQVKTFQDYITSNMLAIPIYDARFARNEIVKINGTQQLFVKVDDVEDIAGGRPVNLRNPEVMRQMDVFIPREYGEPLEVGKLATISDLSGVSQLSKYMSQDEYKSVRDWVNMVGKDGPDKFMTQKAVDRAVAILDYLNDNGTPYVIERDLNPGQIRARLTGTNLQIRLTDVRDNEHYVGRVTDRGAAIYYTTDYQESPRGAMDEYKDITNLEAIRLLRYAQGYAIRDMSKGVAENAAVGIPRQYQSGNRNRNAVYYTDRGEFSAVVKDYEKDGVNTKGAKVFLHISKSGHHSQNRFFADVSDAQSFLKTSVDNARINYANRFELDRLITEFKDNIDNPDFVPNFSPDADVAQLQQKYWEFMSGNQSYLVNPWIDEERYLEEKAELEAAGLPDLMANESFKYDVDSDIEAMVREHFENVLDTTIGQYEPKLLPYYTEDGVLDNRELRFDPVNVGKFMTSEYGPVRNNRDIIQALRLADINPDELQGSAFYNKVIKDNLIKFDELNARDMSTLDSPFMRDMYVTIHNTLKRNGVNPQRILIDDNGVVRYSGQVAHSKNLNKGAFKPIMGEIGQIFDPQPDGSIITKYAGGENHIAVPGYEATIVPQKDGENLSYIERTRLKGYSELMREAIQYQIRTDLLDVNYQGLTGTEPQAGVLTALNSVYRRLYDERHDLDYHDKELAVGLDEDLLQKRTQTESQRVKYANKYGEGSTINADFQARQGLGQDIRNDNFVNVYELTGNENMGVMKTELSDGYYDPIATSGGTNQGLTRYLVDSAKVDPKTGRIIQGDKDDRTALMKHEFMKNQSFNPFDRQQMTFSNLMTASGINVARAAQIDLHGYTFEDGIPMSKEYAERHGVYGTDGKIRQLLIGDKASDGNGNKGVTPIIVDRNMSDEEFNKLSPLKQKVVQTFRNNPELDIVMAKYSSVSRFNGGTARDMVESSNKKPYVDLDGNVHADAISDLPIIVTHMTVDAKTNIYDNDALAEGRGRKANPQLAWALNAMDADGIMAEFYGNNNKAVYNYREYLITVGLDMDEIGTLRDHYEPHNGEERNLLEIPDLVFKDNGTLNVGEMRAQFGKMLDQQGGFLTVPFEMKFPNGELMPKTEDGRTMVPVLSSYLRSGQEFADGTTSNHDYTNNYLNMYMKCVQYLEAEQKLADPSLDAKKRTLYESRINQLPSKAQDDYNRIANDVIKRQFEGKHNYVRDGIMSNKLPHSATAVWTADPELNLDEIAISPAIAENLGVSNGNYIATWRDPVLADGGVRGLKVVIKDDLVGCAINPIIAQSFEGDFDGDSVALVALKTKAANMDLRNKLSQEANLLDLANFTEIDGKRVHPINFNFGLELKVYASDHPEFTEHINDVTLVVNDTYNQFKSGEISHKDMLNVNRQAVKDLSNHVREAFENSNGRPLVYTDMQSHLQSVVNEVVLTGAKGSLSKVEDYMKYLGVEGSISEDGKVNVVKVHDKSLATSVDHENTQYAKEVQAYGTGIAGKYSQRGIAAVRNYAAKEVLDLTHPVSQSVLQAKHDPIDARHKYEALMTTARSIWRGQSVEKTTTYEGESVWVKSDNKDQMRADKWVDKFCEFYEDKNGLNIPVNREQVERLAEVLSDNDGYIINIETVGFDELAAPMDKLSYLPSGKSGYEIVQDLAKDKANLFDGKYTQQFAPSSIQRNMKALEHGETAKALVKQDVIVKKEVAEPKVEKPVQTTQTHIPDVVGDNGRASREALIEQLLSADMNEQLSDEFGPNIA